MAFDPEDNLACVICKNNYVMAEPTHADSQTGDLVLCCWTCREYYGWQIDARGYVPIHEWLEAEKTRLAAMEPQRQQQASTDEPQDDWDDITPMGGFMIDPRFVNGAGGTGSP